MTDESPPGADELDAYDYELPADRIADRPPHDRDGGRLLALLGDSPEHRAVRDLPELLAPGDLLVLNDTRVIPARIEARRATGGKVEILFLSAGSEETTALVRPARKMRAGEVLEGPGGSSIAIVADRGEGIFVVRTTPEPDAIMAAPRARAAPAVPCPRRRTRGPRAVPDGVRARARRGRGADRRAPSHARAPRRAARAGRRHRDAHAPRRARHVPAAPSDGPRARRPPRRAVSRIPDGDRGSDARDAGARRSRRRVRNDRHARARDARHRRRRRRGRARRRRRSSSARGARSASSISCSRTSTCRGARSSMLVAAFAGRERVLRAYEEAVRARYRFYSYGDAMLVSKRAP